MRPHIVLFGLALLLLATQLGSVQAASCHDIEVQAEDILIGRASTKYFYFPIYNYSDEYFEIYAAEVWRDYGEFEITLVDYPDTIFADDDGELTVKVKTGNLDEESFGSAYAKIRGKFSDGTYCGFTNIGETYFDVTVEMQGGNAQCNDLKISAFDVYIQEDYDKTFSFEVENYSDEDFDLYDIEVVESSSYFDAWLYSKPSTVRDNDSETFRVKVSSNIVRADKEGIVKLRARGNFGSTYCSYSSTEGETFTVFVENNGSGSTPSTGDSRIYLNSSTLRVEKGSTGSATLFLGNNSSENFSLDYVSVFDSSSNFTVEIAGYERVVPAFGSAFIKVKAKAYDYAKTGRENAFIEARGHFQNGKTVWVFGDSLGTFPVEVVEKQQYQSGGGTGISTACDYVSLIVPGEKAIEGSGTVFVTIDNRGSERVDVSLYGAGLAIQPKLISVPKKTLVSESISVSSVLPETDLIYGIEATGCSSTKRTKIVSSAEEQPAQEEKQGEGNAELPIDSTGFVALGQAGAIIGLLVIAAALVYFVLRPKGA